MSTSKLQRYTSSMLSAHLGQYTIRENIRPEWLISPDGTRLELDFYIEELATAIEVQGQQHYRYIPHFHRTYDDFKTRLERDQFKRDCCSLHEITLVEVASKQDVKDFLASNRDTNYIDLPEAKIENVQKLRELYLEYIRKRKLYRKLKKQYNTSKEKAEKKKIQKRIMRTTDRLRELRTVLRTVGGEKVLKSGEGGRKHLPLGERMK